MNCYQYFSISTLWGLIFSFVSFCSTSEELPAPELSVFDIVISDKPTIHYQDELIAYDNHLFFGASNQGLGFEFWAINLATEKQFLVQDINIGTEGSFPSDFTVYQDKLYFSATTKEHGRELWVYDKTTQATSLVEDLYVGTDNDGSALSASPKSLKVFDEKLYFFKMSENTDYLELWYFDGTSFKQQSETLFAQYIEDPSAGPYISPSSPMLFIINSKLSILEHSPNVSPKFYSLIDNEVIAIEEDGDLYDSLVNEHIQLGDTFYSIQQGLVSYNAKTKERVELPRDFNEQSIWPTHLAKVDNSIVFMGSHNEIDNGVYAIELSTLEVTLLTQIDAFERSPTRYVGLAYYVKTFYSTEEQIYFFVENEYTSRSTDPQSNISYSNNTDIWFFDMNTNNVGQLSLDKHVHTPSSYPKNKIILNNELYFTAYDQNGIAQLWLIDAELNTLHTLTNFTVDGGINELVALDGKLYFNWRKATNHQSLWAYTPSTHTLSEVFTGETPTSKPFSVYDLTPLNRQLYFKVRAPGTQVEIYSYSPRSNKSKMLTNFTEKQYSIGRAFTPYRNSLYFTIHNAPSQSELWYLYSADGTFGSVTTSQNYAYRNIEDLTVLNDKLYFTHEQDTYLAYYDNRNNKFSEHDISLPNSIDVYGDPFNNSKDFTAADNYLFFSNYDRWNHGLEPFYFSESNQSISILADLAPGFCCEGLDWEGAAFSSNPQEYFAYDNTLYFEANSRLWYSHYTNEQVMPPQILPLKSEYHHLAGIQDLIIFRGALFATADVIKGGLHYGSELIKLDINVSPTIQLNIVSEASENSRVILDGNAIIDEDGDALSIHWQQLLGSDVNIIDADKKIAYFNAPDVTQDTMFEFEVTVSDLESVSKQSFSILVKTSTPVIPVDETPQPNGESGGGSLDIFGLLFILSFVRRIKKASNC